MLYIGKICQISEDKSLVRVNYLGTISIFVPYLQYANSFKRHFSPPRIGEQVILMQIGNQKIALRAIFNNDFSEPAGVNQSKEICEYEDGTKLSYDSKSHTLEVLDCDVINIKTNKDLNITIAQNITINTNNITVNTQTAQITANQTQITSPQIQINGNISANSSSNANFSAPNIDFNGNVSISGNLNVSGNINDSRGDLTGHSHNDSDGGTSNPR